MSLAWVVVRSLVRRIVGSSWPRSVTNSWRNVAPGRGRQTRDFREQLRGAAPERDERDPQAIETGELRVGGQARIEHQVAGILPVVLLPEGDEVEDFLGFLSLA